MSKDTTHLIASVLLLIALVLLVTGLDAGPDLLWRAGFAIVAVAMAFSLATRWVGEGEEENQGTDEKDGREEA